MRAHALQLMCRELRGRLVLPRRNQLYNQRHLGDPPRKGDGPTWIDETLSQVPQLFR